MTRTGLICDLALVIVTAGGGWYWHRHSLGGGDAAMNARAIQDERQVLLGMVMYWKSFKAYPNGDNPAILRTLGGDNPRHAAIFHPRADATNEAGALVDPWGTPYEITVAPQTGPVLRSVGKNKKFGNDDDVTLDWKSSGAARR